MKYLNPEFSTTEYGHILIVINTPIALVTYSDAISEFDITESGRQS